MCVEMHASRTGIYIVHPSQSSSRTSRAWCAMNWPNSFVYVLNSIRAYTGPLPDLLYVEFKELQKKTSKHRETSEDKWVGSLTLFELLL